MGIQCKSVGKGERVEGDHTVGEENRRSLLLGEES